MLSYSYQDFRIRMCTRDNSFEDLNTIHHELGHIQYDQHYKHLPIVFRDGANDGFHEGLFHLKMVKQTFCITGVPRFIGATILCNPNQRMPNQLKTHLKPFRNLFIKSFPLLY